MAFIEKNDPVILNILLTSKGRKLLSTGNLTFKYFAVGDSEMDYNYMREINNYDPLKSNILRAKDDNPNIISFVPKNLSGNPYNTIYTITPFPNDIVNKTSSIGFFEKTGTTFNVDSGHVKQPDVMIFMSGITGGNSFALKKAPTYGASIEEPAIGDLVLVKWTYDSDTTGYTINKNNPLPCLMYRIIDANGTLENDDLFVQVDRYLPNFNGMATGKAGALIYYSAITSSPDYYNDYQSESIESFFSNYQCNELSFPFWNMSVIFTEEIAGVQPTLFPYDRKFVQFKSRKYGGFVSYIQNQIPIYKKLGIIHYTNKSLANIYGEEFYLKTPTLQIPTIMWHKSTGATLGLTLMASGDSKLLTGTTKSLNLSYYDLTDPSGNVVGKVFNELKMFVIEDQELLFAMSYKANRSWTLPDVDVRGSSTPCPVCPTTTPPITPTTTTTTTDASTTTTTTNAGTTTTTTTIAPTTTSTTTDAGPTTTTIAPTTTTTTDAGTTTTTTITPTTTSTTTDAGTTTTTSTTTDAGTTTTTSTTTDAGTTTTTTTIAPTTTTTTDAGTTTTTTGAPGEINTLFIYIPTL